jgi:hypothetical protein
VEKDLASASADIARFQQEKQQRLNNIDVVVSLTLSQIYALVPGTCCPGWRWLLWCFVFPFILERGAGGGR